jgi:hypothetical protein
MPHYRLVPGNSSDSLTLCTALCVCVRWKALQFTQREGTGFPGALSADDG